MGAATKGLETLWHNRLQEARLRLDLTKNFLTGVQHDGNGQRQRAIDLEHLALQEYRHVLKVFSDLVVDGKEPDEEDWQRRMAPGAGLM